MLNKLFQYEEGSESVSDDDGELGSLEKETALGTENVALHDVPYKRQKRQRGEEEGRLMKTIFIMRNFVG